MGGNRWIGSLQWKGGKKRMRGSKYNNGDYGAATTMGGGGSLDSWGVKGKKLWFSLKNDNFWTFWVSASQERLLLVEWSVVAPSVTCRRIVRKTSVENNWFRKPSSISQRRQNFDHYDIDLLKLGTESAGYFLSDTSSVFSTSVTSLLWTPRTHLLLQWGSKVKMRLCPCGGFASFVPNRYVLSIRIRCYRK